MKTFLLLLGFLIPAGLLTGQSNRAISKIYKSDNMERYTVVPTVYGYQYETIFEHKKNRKSPKRSDIVLVKVKSYNIDGSFEETKEARIHLAKLAKNENSIKLQKGIRKMRIGDKYRFFIPQKIKYDPELYVYIEHPMPKVYEVELIDILNQDGTSKHPKDAGRYRPVTQVDNFNTVAIYKLAKQKAYVIAERNRIREQQMRRVIELYGHHH